MPPLRHLGFAVVRTPALAVDEWMAHAAASGSGDYWQRRADSARALSRRPLVAEAIYAASPSFHERLQRWDWQMRDAGDRKMLAAFERYLNRMCFRATPFGLFSTVSFAPLLAGHGWSLDQAAREAAIQRAARVDGEALCTLSAKLQGGEPDPAMRYIVNASLYRAGDRYRFIDWSDASGGDRSYQLGEIDHHPLIAALVERMQGQVLDCAGIAALASGLPQAEDIDLRALVADLIAAKVLLPAIALDPLHADPAGALATALARLPAQAATGQRLAGINALLQAAPGDHALEHFMHADRMIRELTGAAPAALSVQVDAFRTHAQMAVDAGAVDSAIATLDWLMDRFSVRHGPLDSFCEAFAKRYGSGVVPLMEALDPEAGIGYGQATVSNKLLAALGIKRPAAQYAQVPLSPLDQLLFTLIQRDPSALAAPEIVITRADAAGLALTRDGTDGNGMTAVLQFPSMRGADSASAWTAVLAGLDAEGTLNWVSRFCHGDPRLSAAARAHTRQVERDSGPGGVHAEIAYLPQARAVNVMSRPLFWGWRINLAEPAIEPAEGDLPVSDLMLSVSGKRIDLWSRRLGKRVIPHRTSAHRVDDPYNPAVYRFLCALSSHGMRIPRLNWGEVFKTFDYLPRLRFESLVLTPARWHIRKSVLATLPHDAGALRALLAQRRVPRRVELTEADNRLLLDLDDDADLEQLLRMASKRRDLLLVEVMDDLDGRTAPDARPAWRHQVVVPLYRPAHGQAAPAAPPFERDLAQVPVAEAVYVKLYGGQETLDKRVLPEVAAWVAQQRRQGAVGNWFFIRYADPGWHLRVRVFPAAGRDGATLAGLARFAEELQRRGWIARFEFTAYEREMIRYGGAAHIGANETLFGIDSDLAAAILCGEPFGMQAPARWSVAVLAIDALLCDFGMPLQQKLALANGLAASFKQEFAVKDRQLAALGGWYRRHARAMLAALRRSEQAPAWSAQLWRLLDGVSAQRRAIAVPLLQADPRRDMVASQAHMLCNRLFMAQNREFEVLVYDFLARAYRALAAMPGNER
ncbi:MAG: lantibiotic dehydratase [Telluria sp.]